MRTLSSVFAGANCTDARLPSCPVAPAKERFGRNDRELGSAFSTPMAGSWLAGGAWVGGRLEPEEGGEAG